MERTKLTFSQIYEKVFFLFSTHPQIFYPEHKKGRRPKFNLSLILSLMLYQVLLNLSFREVLRIAKRELGVTIPLSTYHYYLKKLTPEFLRSWLAFLEKSSSDEMVKEWLLLLMEQVSLTEKFIR